MERRARKFSTPEMVLLIILIVISFLQFIFAFFPAAKGIAKDNAFNKGTDIQIESIYGCFFAITGRSAFAYAVAFLFEFCECILSLIFFLFLLIIRKLSNSNIGSRITRLSDISSLSINQLRNNAKLTNKVFLLVFQSVLILISVILFFSNASILNKYVFAVQYKYTSVQLSFGSIACGITSLLILIINIVFSIIFMHKESIFWIKQIVLRRKKAEELESKTDDKVIVPSSKEEINKPKEHITQSKNDNSLDDQMKKISIISEYNKLYKSGVITLEEFEAKKKEIL